MNQQAIINVLQSEVRLDRKEIAELKAIVALRDRESANKERRIKQLHADYWMAVHGSRRLEKRNRELHTECQTADAKFTQLRKDAAADRANLLDRNGELCMSINSLREENKQLSNALLLGQRDLATCENKLACKCAEVDQREKYFYPPSPCHAAKDKEIKRLRDTIRAMDRDLGIDADKLTLKEAECERLNRWGFRRDEEIGQLKDKVKNLEGRLQAMSNMDRSQRDCIADLRSEKLRDAAKSDLVRGINTGLCGVVDKLKEELKQERAYSYETWLDFWRESKATAHMGEMIWRLIREKQAIAGAFNGSIACIERLETVIGGLRSRMWFPLPGVGK